MPLNEIDHLDCLTIYHKINISGVKDLRPRDYLVFACAQMCNKSLIVSSHMFAKAVNIFFYKLKYGCACSHAFFKSLQEMCFSTYICRFVSLKGHGFSVNRFKMLECFFKSKDKSLILLAIVPLEDDTFFASFPSIVSKKLAKAGRMMNMASLYAFLRCTINCFCFILLRC